MSIGPVAFRRVAEMLMGEMDKAATAGDFRMAAAYAQMAADAEDRALALIPESLNQTREIVRQSQWALVDRGMEYESR